jgi:hypothetical protein
MLHESAPHLNTPRKRNFTPDRGSRTRPRGRNMMVPPGTTGQRNQASSREMTQFAADSFILPSYLSWLWEYRVDTEDFAWNTTRSPLMFCFVDFLHSQRFLEGSNNGRMRIVLGGFILDPIVPTTDPNQVKNWLNRNSKLVRRTCCLSPLRLW